MTLPPDSSPGEDHRIRHRVRALGAELVLDKNKAGILARPKGLLGPEIKDAIHAAREGIIRTLLFEEALIYFEHHVERRGGSVRDPQARAYRHGLEAADDDLNEAWLEEDLDGFKAALRKWLKLNLRAFARAWAGREQTTAQGSCNADSEQQTLEQAV